MIDVPRVLGGGDPRALDDAGRTLARALATTAGDGPGLYDGEAGIAWALARAARTDEALRSVARERLAALEGTSAVGLADGAAGLAFALLDGGRVLGDARLVAAGAEAARHVAEGVADAGTDYLSGAGGAIALLAWAVRRDAVPASVLSAACRAGERIVDTARPTPSGWCWDMAGVAMPPVCGLAHGSAGMALALYELADTTQEPRWADAGALALRFVRAHFRRGVCGWPDLRAGSGDEATLDASCGATWCHGAAGIGLTFLRVHELTGERAALADASAALYAVRQGVAALAAGHAGDASLCHGVGGIVDLYATAYDVLGGVDHLRAARRVAALALEVSAGQFGSGDPRDPDAAGLFLGRAGVATWLLRSVDPGAGPTPLLLR